MAAILLAGPLTRFGFCHFRTGFSVLRWGAYGGCAGAVVSLLGLLGGGRRRAAAILGAGIGFAALTIPWSFLRNAKAYPPIHDISTDGDNPPRFAVVLPLRKDAPNTAEPADAGVRALQKSAYPDLRPLSLTAPATEVFPKALEAAEEMGWEIVSADTAAGRIEATDTTFWFGFKDDVVIRVAARGGESVVDVRSVSRVGKGDVGANARRIRRYRERLTGRF